MATALYLIGFLVLIAGLAWGASALGVPTLWITIGAVVAAGLAIIGAANHLQATPPREQRHRETAQQQPAPQQQSSSPDSQAQSQPQSAPTQPPPEPRSPDRTP